MGIKQYKLLQVKGRQFRVTSNLCQGNDPVVTVTCENISSEYSRSQCLGVKYLYFSRNMELKGQPSEQCGNNKCFYRHYETKTIPLLILLQLLLAYVPNLGST